MMVVENVQLALISHHRKLFSMFSYTHKMYKDSALKLLELVNPADQTGHHLMFFMLVRQQSLQSQPR